MNALVLCGKTTEPWRTKPTDSRYCDGKLYQPNYDQRDERETRTDGEHLGVELVGLGEDSLGPQIVEEAVVHERREPGSDAVGTSMGVGSYEHVET